ncbi:MAG: queuosine precursor transporter [Rhodobiaceae bacterium]|jgi:uncharacterized PurR-regulated membrane protein YhhQ (DUF165 family)|nr:queuosine precursor transporter [Rhodobiaceae bacterium]MDB4831951.1 queuosine precursor transporter [Hyphomicrobiales bacterium]
MIRSRIIIPVLCMILVIVASNILVQYPFKPLGLHDLLTWGAFTYPVAFFITDITNRRYGPQKARWIVFAGFIVAVFLSIWFATPRIAIASGTAFLTAQLIDVTIFSKLRNAKWWKAPLISSSIGSVIDTIIFFSIAFSASFVFFGSNDDFALSQISFFGMDFIQVPRWFSWAVGDLVVKFIVALALLFPFAMIRNKIGVWKEFKI